jgi:putative permease
MTLAIKADHIRIFAAILIATLILLAVGYIDNLLTSFILATVLNYLLSPLTNSLERSGLKRTTSTLLTFLIFSLGLFVATKVLTPVISSQFESFKIDFPKYTSLSLNYIATYQKQLIEYLGTDFGFNITQQIQLALVEWTKAFAEDLPSFVSGSLTTIAMAPFLAYFMILDGRKLTKSYLKLIPNKHFELVLNLFYQINSQIGDFIRARILEALIVGGFVFLGLVAIDFPYSLILGLFAAVTNLIPYIGPFIGGVPALIIAIILQHGWFQISILFLVYLIAQLIDIFLIIPLVVAKIVNLHPVVVLLVIVLGAQTMGILGMIISIPLAGAVKVSARAIYSHLIDFKG